MTLFGTIWRWVINYIIYIFRWTIPFKFCNVASLWNILNVSYTNLTSYVLIGYTFCQACARDYWSEAESETCKKRVELYLQWGTLLTTALLIYLGVTLFLTLGTAVIFLFNLSTPVVKSAGGKTCLLMLASLTVACCSTLCHFSSPSHIGCLLKQPLFFISFTVCLACVTVRSFQVYRALDFTV